MILSAKRCSIMCKDLLKFYLYNLNCVINTMYSLTSPSVMQDILLLILFQHLVLFIKAFKLLKKYILVNRLRCKKKNYYCFLKYIIRKTKL